MEKNAQGIYDTAQSKIEKFKEAKNHQALGYAAGYTAFHFRNKYPYLGSKTSKYDKNAERGLSWIMEVSKGWLRLPSKTWFKAAQIIDQAMKNFHKEEILKKDEYFIIDKVTDKAYEVIEKTINFELTEEKINKKLKE